MGHEPAYFEKKPLLAVGLCFAIWITILLLFPTTALMQDVLKVVVWLIPLYVLIREPLCWRIEARHWKFILLMTLGFLAYFGVWNQIMGRGGLHGASIGVVVSSVIAGPVEEMIFRGLILQPLRRKFTFWQANVASSLIFTVYHFPLWIARGRGFQVGDIGWVFLAGLLFGWLFWKTKSLGPSALVHTLHDLAGAVLL